MDGVFDAILDSAILLDKTGRITQWSTGAITLFGYTKKDVIGRSVNLIYDKSYPFPKLIHDALQQQKKWQEDTIYIRKNGTKGNCKTFLCPLPPHSQSKASALLIHYLPFTRKHEEETLEKHHDLFNSHHTFIANLNLSNLLTDSFTLLEQTEKKLRESELRFHLLAENATDLISRHNPDGIFLYLSPACTASTGYTPDDLLGKNIYHLIHNDDHAKFKKIFARRKEIPTNKPIVYRIKQKEGDFRWFESNVRLILDEKNRTINEIQLASRDVTDRVLDKKARLRGQQLAHVFRLSTMEEMASGIAHEISQPLAAIVNYTRGCIRHFDNKVQDFDQLRNVMEKAAIQAERAGEIVQRLKNFFCKGQLIKTSCKLNNLIRETVALMKDELLVAKTKIECELDKDSPFIFIDKIQIQQVLLNLLQNAMEAMQEAQVKDKLIHIQTTSTADMIEVTISDTGVGFSKEIINKVFMPFFTTKAHGRGMGLAICRSIVEAHGGEFTINPNTTSKSWIRFTLPISI